MIYHDVSWFITIYHDISWFPTVLGEVNDECHCHTDFCPINHLIESTKVLNVGLRRTDSLRWYSGPERLHHDACRHKFTTRHSASRRAQQPSATTTEGPTTTTTTTETTTKPITTWILCRMHAPGLYIASRDFCKWYPYYWISSA